MLKPISRIEEAFRDTCVHRAEGLQVDDIGSLYGMPRPSWVKHQHWRKALEKTALGPRGVSQTLFLFLRHALMQLAEKVTVETSLTGKGFTGTSAVSASSPYFTNRHVGRYCLLVDSAGNESVFYSTAEEPFLTQQVYLSFSGRSSSQFDAAPSDISTLHPGTCTLYFLPFLIFELTPSVVYPALGAGAGGNSAIPSYFVGKKSDAARILVRLFGTGFKVPGTFVQEAVNIDLTSGELTPEDFVPSKELGGPTGGYVMEDTGVTQENDGNNYFPIYLGEGLKNANLLLDILRQNFLAAGVRIDFEQMLLQDFE